MKLFYVTKGPGYQGLFVHADTPHEAFRLSGSLLPRAAVYDLSQTALCPSVMDWRDIPMVVLTRD